MNDKWPYDNYCGLCKKHIEVKFVLRNGDVLTQEDRLEIQMSCGHFVVLSEIGDNNH